MWYKVEYMTQDTDVYWMKKALELAHKAQEQGEVPVGAVLVSQGQAIATGYNQSISNHDPCGHAEIICLRAAGAAVNNYRLLDTTLYVTLEPCPMCASALVHARVSRVVFGAFDPKAGAGGSVFQLLADPCLNHQIEITSGVLEIECREQLQAFFKQRRAVKKQQKLDQAAKK
tara:strand:+ start:5907 stop:6425 length:519 start_codon:yes stop_codon:yes gene_type:complete